MFRISLTSLVIAALFFTSACTSSSNGTVDKTDGQMDNTEQPAVGGLEENMDNNGSDLYEVKVLDDQIKSPRKELTGTVNGVDITINYGSPAVNDRTIYGDLVPYGKVWRTGANEATRITFSQPVMVGEEGKKLDAGTYSLFTVPTSKEDWTVILNKTADQWGAYDYAEDQDAARVKGMARPTGKTAERMDFALTENEIAFMWADTQVAFKVAAAAK